MGEKRDVLLVGGPAHNQIVRTDLPDTFRVAVRPTTRSMYRAFTEEPVASGPQHTTAQYTLRRLWYFDVLGDEDTPWRDSYGYLRKASITWVGMFDGPTDWSPDAIEHFLRVYALLRQLFIGPRELPA